MWHALIDEYFSLPLGIVRRKLSGVRDSVASSKWRSSFVKSLKSLPEFTVTSLDFAIPQCDACHLGGRMSTYVGRLSGEPYDPITLQVCLLIASSYGQILRIIRLSKIPTLMTDLTMRKTRNQRKESFISVGFVHVAQRHTTNSLTGR
jgi:hypothetical protein